MVRILSSGEIVSDDDPRAQQGDTRARQNIGRINHDPDEVARHYEGGGHGGGVGGGGGQQVSVFDGLNQRLIGYGFPRFNIGQHTIEPIVSVGFILAGLLLGLPGLLLAAVLFFVSKMSTQGGGLAAFFGGQGQQGVAGSRPSGSRSAGSGSSSQGGGYRLGRS